ncbi:unnamed protein product [Diatraea saccharalis]|uniref:Farnesyl pyrophosphate synthase n=1 Tax=Diatraea saccharalis TaxID=40085 RepID=A0A9N9RG95_9NEOP|nr:unnamed protein product [Diatraea saccharalis]
MCLVNVILLLVNLNQIQPVKVEKVPLHLQHIAYFLVNKMYSFVSFRIINKTTRFYHTKSSLLRPVQFISNNKMLTNTAISQNEEKEIFMNTLPIITETILKNPKFTELPGVGSWMKKVLEYNVGSGKKSRGLATVYSYKMIEKPDNITEESLRLACIMGWCVEMLHSYLLVLDDIMDHAITRRGVPCWYRLPEVGLGAINDSVLMHMSMFYILKTYFSQKSCYANILDTFHNSLLNTSIGQHLDYTMAHHVENNYNYFTMEQYMAIVQHKTAYYTFSLPVCLGLYLANKMDIEMHKKAKEITIEIGNFFQIQDDFIDCFGDESVTGKIGTDIQEGKCTWLAVMALQRCNASQRSEFEQCYGSKDPDNVQRIKRLYETLELPCLYKEYEQKLYESLEQRVKSEHSGELISSTIGLRLFETIYKRKG